MYEELREWLDSIEYKVSLVALRGSHSEESKQRFWNLIYYFNEHHLPYEFMLPYQDQRLA